MNYAYPPEFVEALLATAERANLSNAAKIATQKLRYIISSPPSPINNRAIKELAPKLAWGIIEGNGWFYGPDQTY